MGGREVKRRSGWLYVPDAYVVWILKSWEIVRLDRLEIGSYLARNVPSRKKILRGPGRRRERREGSLLSPRTYTSAAGAYATLFSLQFSRKTAIGLDLPLPLPIGKETKQERSDVGAKRTGP